MADKRLIPARPDLAASYLKGKVDAQRYVDGHIEDIEVGRASLRTAPTDDAMQDSELLYGERVTVYDKRDGWAWVQASRDRYVGYVRAEALGEVVGDGDHHACLVVLAGADEDDDAGTQRLLAGIGKRLQVLGCHAADRFAEEADTGDGLVL